MLHVTMQTIEDEIRMEEGQQIRVLVVDDEPLLCELLCAVLSDDGFKVHAALSLEQAISILKTFQIHVVVTDVQMPNGSGIDLLRKINSMQEVSPLVYLVSAFSKINKDEARRLGAVDLLHKPLNYNELSKNIAHELHEQRIASEG